MGKSIKEIGREDVGFIHLTQDRSQCWAHRNEPPGSRQGAEFIEYCSRHQTACLKVTAKSYNVASRTTEHK
jgi:hypothetical protein